MTLIEPTDVLTAVATASTCGLIVNGLRAGYLHRRLRTDPLTGLANRTGLKRAFDRTRPSPGWCVAALMIDLNNFKTINDTHGHRTGDQVLIEVGQRLWRYQQRGRLAVRISGDEFVLWLGSYTDAPSTWIHVTDIARDVAASIALPMHLAERELVVTASVGTGIASASAGTLEDLLEPADHAMYADKRAHRGVRLPVQRGEATA